MCGPSSGCDLTFGAAIQDVWGVLLGFRTPHTSCIAAPKVKSQPEDGPHIGPKHVVVVLV